MGNGNLREFEELVLLCVKMNGENASGVSIQQALDRDAGRNVSLGAIYTALDRLIRKKLVNSWLGEPTPVRGGRRKRYYSLTKKGLNQLSEVRRIREGLWAKIESQKSGKEATP